MVLTSVEQLKRSLQFSVLKTSSSALNVDSGCRYMMNAPFLVLVVYLLPIPF